MVKKSGKDTIPEESFYLLTRAERVIFEIPLYPMFGFSEKCILGLLDKAEAALKRSRIRFKKRMAEQRRQEQKCKKG